MRPPGQELTDRLARWPGHQQGRAAVTIRRPGRQFWSPGSLHAVSPGRSGGQTGRQADRQGLRSLPARRSPGRPDDCLVGVLDRSRAERDTREGQGQGHTASSSAVQQARRRPELGQDRDSAVSAARRWLGWGAPLRAHPTWQPAGTGMQGRGGYTTARAGSAWLGGEPEVRQREAEG